MRKLPALFCLAALSATAGSVPAHAARWLVQREQAVVPADEARLAEGTRLERELPAGAVQSFHVTLTSGQFVKVVIEQAGNDLSLSLSGPDGTALAEIDGRYHGPEPISLIAVADGKHRFEVRAVDKFRVTARYIAHIETLRRAEPQDERELAAERTATEAKRLVARATAESRRSGIAAWQEALRRWRELEDPFGEAQALNTLGFLHTALGDNLDALTDYDQALALWRKLGYRFGEAETLGNMAAVHSAVGDKRKALDLYQQALTMRRELSDRRGEAVTLTNMSGAYFVLGEVRAALDSLELAHPLWKEIDDKAGETGALNATAAIAAAVGETDKAVDAYGRMLDIARVQQNARGEAVALMNMAALYGSLGDHQRALTTVDQALPLLRASGDHSTEPYALLTAARSYDGLGDKEKSLAAYESAVAIARETTDRRVHASALNAIGGALFANGDRSGAAARYAESLQLARAVGDRRVEAAVLANLGRLHHAQGDELTALEDYGSALTTFQETQDGAGEASALLGLARIDRDRDRLLEARARVDTALAIVESRRSRVAAQDLRASLIAANRQLFEFNIDLLMRLHRLHPTDGFDRAALRASESARARSLLEILAEARADVRRGGDPVLLDRERALREQINGTALRQSRLLGAKHTEEEAASVQSALDALIAEHQRVLTLIRVSTPRYAALTQPEPIGWEEIQGLLDPDELLLEFSVGEERSFLWAVTPGSIASFDLAPGAEIERAGRRVRELLTISDRTPATDREYLQAAERLSRLTLAPVAGMLRSKRLLIVPDGILQYLPFAALPIPDGQAPPRGGNLLGGSHEIVTLPSASVLATIRRDLAQRRPASKTLAVLADPVFRADDSRVTLSGGSARPASPTAQSEQLKGRDYDVLRSARESGLLSGEASFSRLPATRREAEEILKLAAPAGSLRALDFEASRARATSPDLGQYRIVHIATHGLLNGVHPELSGLILSLVDARGVAQDGFLRLQDVYNLNLPVDLVVLSACQTGLGKDIRGEGIVGLTRGFMYAGAARVVVSLWKIDDDATAALMQRFYKGMLARHLSPAAALRDAQLDLAKIPRWRSPYYWAGFVLQGEPR